MIRPLALPVGKVNLKVVQYMVRLLALPVSEVHEGALIYGQALGFTCI
jgi:hypothetical protein